MQPRRQILFALGAALGGAAALGADSTTDTSTTDASGELTVRAEGER